MGGSRSGERARKRVLLGLVPGVAVVGASVAAELRHRSALKADPVGKLLDAPLAGDVSAVSSPDGTALHVEAFGPDDAPTIVLVPGWTEPLQIWDLLTRGLLGRGFRVVSFDLRGQGRSGPAVDDDYAIARFGEDVEAVLAAACGGRDDVILAGHSMGGMSIMAWAGAFDAAARVRAAALINTGAVGLIAASTVLPVTLPPQVRRELAVKLVLTGGPPPALSTPVSRAIARRMAFGPDASPAMVAMVERMTWEAPVKSKIAAGQTLENLDVTAGVARLNVPTLVVAGDHDRLTPVSLAQELVETLPRLADFMLIERMGHMGPLERPDAIEDALVRLASGVGIESGLGTG